ncbi:MAG: hypothetical protein K0R54_2505 [Clostridiaceae bacterium]|jgi:hypothetical protein|nr:hypothetical protein [Clostridiaceae bacterium]
MNCTIFNRKLNDYIEGNINNDLALAMENHMEHCQKCRKIYNEEISMDKMFRTALSTEGINFISSRTDIMKSIDPQRYAENKNKLKFHFKKYIVPYLSTAAVVIILIMIPNYNLGKKTSILSQNSIKNKSVTAEQKTSLNTKMDNERSTESTSSQKNVISNVAVPLFEKKFEGSFPENNFHTPWKASLDNKLSACVDGIGNNASEEGIGTILLKNNSNNDVWRLQLKNNSEQNSTKFIEWYDNNNLFVIIGYGHGTLSPGGSVYLLNINDLKTTAIYEEDSNKKDQIISVDKSMNRINFKVLIYDDDNYVKSHTENWYISPSNADFTKEIVIKNESGHIVWTSNKK